VPVLLALSGRRPAQRTATATFRIGLLLVGVAAAMTVIGATMRNAGLDPVSIMLLAGGAVLSTLGFGACGPWLLERLEGLANRLPLAGRIAFRDTARARSRSSPIVTAILAGCAAAIALGAWQTSRDLESLSGWRPNVYPDQIAVTGAGAAEAAQNLRELDGVVAGGAVTYLAPEDPAVFASYRFPDARDANGKLINLLDQCINCNPGAFEPYQAYLVSAATPEALRLARAESAADALLQGRAILLTFRPITATTLEILFQREANGEIATVRRVNLPVHVMHVEPYGTHPQVFLPDPTIQELGLVPGGEERVGAPETFVIEYDHALTAADVTRAREVAARVPETYVVDNSPPERAGAGFRIVTILLVLLFAVSVTGVAIALGEAESRPEQRSLLALGADPRLRRRIVAARAAVIALLAGALAVPAGLLPIWGMFLSRGSPVAVPALEIAGALVALPVLAVLSAFLLSRPIPDWAAFRGIGARE
jgi:putative ABC transport system permease protein